MGLRKVSLRKKNYDVIQVVGNTPVSNSSLFSNDSWCFFEIENERHIIGRKSKMTINWARFNEVIHPDLILIVKVITFQIIHNTDLKRAVLMSKNIKPITLCVKVINFLSFISQFKEGNTNKVEAQDFFSKSPLEIQRTLFKYERTSFNGLKQFLKVLTSDLIRKELERLTGICCKPSWTINDIDVLEIPSREVTKPNYGGYGGKLPDELILFLIKHATSDVISFLKRIDRGVSCNYSNEYIDSLRFDSGLDLKIAFDEYTKLRLFSVNRMSAKGNRQSCGGFYFKRFAGRFGISVNDFRNELARIQWAARYIILQFTGVRYSEGASFKVGCVQKKFDSYYLQGTVSKGKNDRRITNTDYWVAIPIVRDAVLVLELCSVFTKQDSLFASGNAAVINVKNVAMNEGALQAGLNRYLFDIDVDGRFSNRSSRTDLKKYMGVYPQFFLGSHRIRHTLAFEFHKHRSNLTVTSYHFKHAYFAVRFYKVPNEVTLGYGNIGIEIFKNASVSEEVKEVIVNSIYSPESPIAGSGAEKFIKAREAFFIGEYNKGRTLKEIMKGLLKRNIPFADVGLGYCGGKENIINEDGSAEPPPCIGQLRCNPNRCDNAIITQTKVNFWRALRDNNLKLLKDEKLSHMHENLSFFVEEANSVLKKLTNGNT